LFVINLGCLVVLAGPGFAWIFCQDLTRAFPEVEHLAEYASPAATRVYAADGSPLGEFYQEKRYPVPPEQIPPLVQQAFIAAEDASFYLHLALIWRQQAVRCLRIGAQAGRSKVATRSPGGL
jgi:penicillin-binding protein 1A